MYLEGRDNLNKITSLTKLYHQNLYFLVASHPLEFWSWWVIVFENLDLSRWGYLQRYYMIKLVLIWS